MQRSYASRRIYSRIEIIELATGFWQDEQKSPTPKPFRQQQLSFRGLTRDRAKNEPGNFDDFISYEREDGHACFRVPRYSARRVHISW